MDVFYYWKNHEADLKARRIGRFKSTPGKLRELVDGYPDFLWAFTTPKGRRGEVQLIARLRWSDRPTVKHKPEPGHVYLSSASTQSTTTVTRAKASIVASH
jgi:hypothetical protein